MAARQTAKARRRGGVAVYVKSVLQSVPWIYTADDATYELLWVRVGDTFIGALYHPPRPQYNTAVLLDYIEACMRELCRDYPMATIVLAGDFHQLTDSAVIEQTGLVQLVQQPTRGASILDRLFVSSPAAYTTLRVVASTVRSDHRAIVAYTSRLHPTARPRPLQLNRTVISRRRNTLCFCSTFPPQSTLQLIRLTVLSLLLISSTTLRFVFLITSTRFAPSP